MTEKEILDKIFEFETYCTARFDSEERVAMAVYDYVKQMKLKYKKKLTEGNELSNIIPNPYGFGFKPNPPESKSTPPPPAPQPQGYPYEFMNKHGWAAGIKPKYIPKPNTMGEVIEVPKQLLLDILASMEKDNLERYNNMPLWPLTIEEYIEQGKMPKYYYELRKLLPKT